MRKLFYRFKLIGCVWRMAYHGAVIDRINNMVYPAGDTREIKEETPYYDKYVRSIEKLYSAIVESANCMLMVGLMDYYETQVEYIKQLEPLIWDVKAA